MRLKIASALLAAFGALGTTVTATAAGVDEDSVTGFVETRQAWTSHSGEYALEEYRAQVEGTWKSDSGITFRARLNALETRRLDVSSFSEVRFDELFISKSIGACGIKAGIQTVAWGLADRLRVVDVVNPMDLRESYFGDWDRKRLPVGMLNTECDVGGGSIQFLAIPQTRFNRQPSALGRFSTEFVEERIRAAGATIQDGGTPTSGNPEDWNFGLQVSGRLMDADLGFYAYRGWEHERSLQQLSPIAYRLQPSRFSMLGVSLAIPIGPLVLRGELAGRGSVTSYATTPLGQVSSAQVRQNSGLLGIDYNASPLFLGAQYFEQHIGEIQGGLIPNKRRLATFTFRHHLMQDRLLVGAYLSLDLEDQGNYLSLEAQYEVSPKLILRIAAERFKGLSSTSFGRFSDQSRTIVQARYSF